MGMRLGVGVVSSIDVGDVPCAGIGARLNVGSLITAASGLLLLLGLLAIEEVGNELHDTGDTGGTAAAETH